MLVFCSFFYLVDYVYLDQFDFKKLINFSSIKFIKFDRCIGIPAKEIILVFLFRGLYIIYILISSIKNLQVEKNEF